MDMWFAARRVSMMSTGSRSALGESRGLKNLIRIVLLVYFVMALVAIVFNIPTIGVIKLSQYLSGLVVLGTRLDGYVQIIVDLLMHQF